MWYNLIADNFHNLFHDYVKDHVRELTVADLMPPKQARGSYTAPGATFDERRLEDDMADKHEAVVRAISAHREDILNKHMKPAAADAARARCLRS